MKLQTKSRFSLALAGILPLMPLVRSALPFMELEGPSAAPFVLRWVIGIAICGYDAISKASSVSISPVSATLGVPYSGTITYSGGHAGAVESMSINGTCLGSATLVPGLTVTYNGVNTATVSGTPTSGLGTVNFTVEVTDGGNCSGGLYDTRSTSIIIGNTGGGPVAPTMSVVPQNTVAQVGSDVILSGGASGNPTPSYFWANGLNRIPGATSSLLVLPGVQLSNSGNYTLYASNSQGTVNSLCYLTTALTPGSNILALLYTNYAKGDTALVMSSFITNVPAANNTYSWQYNHSSIGVTTPTLSLTAAQTLPSKSGIYSAVFNSTVGSTNIVNNQIYDSYWIFGYPPSVSAQPSPQTVAAGGNATFSFTMGGGNYASVFLYQNSTNLAGQTYLALNNPAFSTITTNISLTISNVTPASAGSYSFVVTNYWGSITSSAVALTVPSSLSVTAPQGQTNYAGKNITFSVTPSGTSPFVYQWQKGSANLNNGGTVSGVNTSVLSIAPAAIGDSGNYQVIVTNASGSVTSGVAPLLILPVPPLGVLLSGTNLTFTGSGGVPGSNYIVEVSSDLTAGWLPLQTNTITPNGSFSFTDVDPPGASNRFYRLQFP